MITVEHGAYSTRRWHPIAEQITEELHVVAPWTARPAYLASVSAWARVEAQLKLVGDWLDEHGLLDEKGKPRPAVNLLDRLESRAAKLRHALGLTPVSLAALLRAFAEAPPTGDDELERLRAEGRRALEAGSSETQ